MSQRVLSFCTLVAMTCAVAGCGDRDVPPRVAVRGKVTLNGELIPAGLITFLITSPAGTFTEAVQIINGEYSSESVPAGAALVGVDTKPAEAAFRMSGPNPKAKANAVGIAKAGKGGGDFPKLPEGVTSVVPIPDSYRNPESSGLKVAIATSGVTTYDIVLVGAKK